MLRAFLISFLTWTLWFNQNQIYQTSNYNGLKSSTPKAYMRWKTEQLVYLYKKSNTSLENVTNLRSCELEKNWNNFYERIMNR